MRENPKPQEIYRHFKGNFYQIITLAKHSESGEILVIYQALYGDCQVYARPLTEFMSETDKSKYPQSLQQYRFEKVSQIEAVGYDVSKEIFTEEKRESMERKAPETVAAGTADERTYRTDSNAKTEDILSTNAENGEEQELNIDPLVMEFLDADSYEQKLNILAALHCRITNEMIDTMAAASDIEINAGDVEERYEALKNCILTLEKYECNRLR